MARYDYPDPPPSDAFDGTHTTEEIETRYKELYHKRLAAHGGNVAAGDRLPHDEHMELLGDLRLAHCRKYREMHGVDTPREGSPFADASKRVSSITLAPEGQDAFACAVCSEVKPATKYPTVSGKPGVREAVCRDCKKSKVPAVP